MNLIGAFRPRPHLTEEERETGLRMMTWQAVSASGADGLASGGFLAAFALILGASNTQIGIMAAIPSIVQPMQILAVVLVERLRMRKAIAVSAFFATYATWIPIALIPFVLSVPHPGAVTLLLAFTAVRGVTTAFVATSWSGWLRDVVPQDVMGSFFARLLRLATIAAAVSGMLGAVYIDIWKGNVADENIVYGYSIAMLLGSVLLGLSSVGFMARIPEPRMAEAEGPGMSMRRILIAPFVDRTFRPLIVFLFMWNFAANLAAPFFAVYMLKVLELPLTLVVGLGVVSQIANVLFLRVWGSSVDQFGSKAILSISTSLYFLAILGWTFTSFPDKHALSIPLLVFLHILMGIASAGINISSTTIRMKMAPQAQATSYLTGASLASNVGAGISPLLGGMLADYFSVRQLQVGFQWMDPSRTIEFPAVHLVGFDFLFVIAFILGFATLNALAAIREEGEVDQQVVLDSLMTQTRDNLQSLNSVRGLSFMSHFPYSYVRHVPRFAGLDVAANVTTYQIASSMRHAVLAMASGGVAARGLAGRIYGAVLSAARKVELIGEHSVGMALHATRGAMLAANEAGMEASHVAEDVLESILKALATAGADPRVTYWGVAYGAVQGADEADEDIGEAASSAIEAARETAAELGMTESEAIAAAAHGALDAATAIGPEASEQVRENVLDSMIGPITGDSQDPESAEESEL
jgi:MFS family permease